MKLSVTRKKKFGCSSAHYWVITSTTREMFARDFGLGNVSSVKGAYGLPMTRIDEDALDEIGTRIDSGSTIEIEVKDGGTVFACSSEGFLSNEIDLAETKVSSITIESLGGVKRVPHPVIVV